MVTMMQRWYYQLFDEEFGPVTEDVLRELLAEGTLSGSDSVRREDTENWEAADAALLEMPDIDAMLAEVPSIADHFDQQSAAHFAQSLSDIEFVFEDRVVADTETESHAGSVTAIAAGPADSPQRRRKSGNGSNRSASRESRARDAAEVNSMIEESLFSDDEPTSSDDAMFTPHAPLVAPASYRPKFETRTLPLRTPDPEPVAESLPAPRKSAMADVVESALNRSDAKERRRIAPGTARDRATFALLCVLLLAFGAIQFRDYIAEFFRNPMDRYSTRTQLAIAALEAVDAELQSVIWRSQVDSISRELGFYKQLLEAESSPSDQSKAVIAAISSVLETSQLKPENTAEQRMLLDQARNHLQEYWRG